MLAFNPVLPLAVAFSGGADSTALLLACARKWPGQVLALHVNHGLQQAAQAFEEQCRALCAQLQLPLLVQAVDARAAPGASPEDAARKARYQALLDLALMEQSAVKIKTIAIAQHADDQVETLLLAWSRGAGLKGLSGMPAHWTRKGIDFVRPLLCVAGADIRQWLAHNQQTFVEDPSNHNLQFTRNRIRARLLPVLQAVFPHFRDTFARSALHMVQAQELLDELASQDILSVSPKHDGLLSITSLRGLRRARQANLLRYWLNHEHRVIPSTAQLNELLKQLADCSTRGHRLHIKLGSGFVQRQGEYLTWVQSPAFASK